MTVDGAADLWRAIAMPCYRSDPAHFPPGTSRRDLDRGAANRLHRLIERGSPLNSLHLVPGWQQILADAGITVRIRPERNPHQ